MAFSPFGDMLSDSFYAPSTFFKSWADVASYLIAMMLIIFISTDGWR